MVLTADVYLPEESDLTVQEISVSSPTLFAGSFHLGKYCEYANNVSYIALLLAENDFPNILYHNFIFTYYLCQLDCIIKVTLGYVLISSYYFDRDIQTSKYL